MNESPGPKLSKIGGSLGRGRHRQDDQASAELQQGRSQSIAADGTLCHDVTPPRIIEFPDPRALQLGFTGSARVAPAAG